jgi:hypothetical protein
VKNANNRSRAYPALDLCGAIDVLRLLVEVFNFREGDRDSIARHLGHSNGASGVAARKIASLHHFGLLERRESKYRTTALARHICNSRSDESLLSALRRAFLTPPLFRELVDAYRPTGAVPRYLADALQEHGVTEAAKYEVAKIFMASGEYAGVLAADGVFLDEKGAAVRAVVEPVPAAPPIQLTAPAAAPQASASPDLQILRFFVTDRKLVELKFPAGLNEDDIALVKKQVEFLEMQVRLSRPAPALPFRRARGTGDPA